MRRISLVLAAVFVLSVMVATAAPAMAHHKHKDKKDKNEDKNIIVGSNEDNDKVVQVARDTGDVCNFAICAQENDADFDTGANLGRVQETGPGNLDGPITTINDQTAQQGNQIGSGNQNQDFTDQNNVGVIEDND